MSCLYCPLGATTCPVCNPPAPVRYPCQDPAGLPESLAAALVSWAAKSPARVSFQCYRACEALQRAAGPSPALRIVGGYVRLEVPYSEGERTVGGMLHWWIELDGRIIDPTRQQLRRGPVTYWRALPDHQGADGFALVCAVGRLLNYDRTKPGSGQRIQAALCEPEPCYQDQGWQRVQRAMRRAA